MLWKMEEGKGDSKRGPQGTGKLQRLKGWPGNASSIRSNLSRDIKEMGVQNVPIWGREKEQQEQRPRCRKQLRVFPSQ